KNLYDGGRLLSWGNKAAKLTPLLWGNALVPVIFLFFVPREPVLLVYVAALSLNVAYVMWFARWMRKVTEDWVKANQLLSSYELKYAPRGEGFSFMLRAIFAIPPAYFISMPRAALTIVLIIFSLLLEGLAFSYFFHIGQNLQLAMQVDVRNIKEL